MITRFAIAIAIALAFSAMPSAVSAQAVVGPAIVVDGDSLIVGSVQVRLFGIDAPEGKQTCNRNGEAWPCGEASAGKLRSLVEDKIVQCQSKGLDAFGRTVAICEASGLELNRAMVASGWATAFQSYSSAYIADETRARVRTH